LRLAAKDVSPEISFSKTIWHVLLLRTRAKWARITKAQALAVRLMMQLVVASQALALRSSIRLVAASRRTAEAHRGHKAGGARISERPWAPGIDDSSVPLAAESKSLSSVVVRKSASFLPQPHQADFRTKPH